MKKFFALLLTLLMVLSMVACGQQAPADDGAAAPDDAVVDDAGTPDDAGDAAVELAGTMTQEVTVNLLGNDIPVAVLRNFDNDAFRIDYAFNGNPVFAEGYVVDGAWEIVNTNNDFTFGTIEAVLPVLDDAAWVAADSELVVVEAGEDEAPADEGAAAPAGAVADGQYDITLNMMGNDVPVAVTIKEGTFELNYEMMGNPVNVKGTIGADGTWAATELSNPMAANVVPMAQAAMAG